MMSLSSLVTGPTLVITHPNDFSQHTGAQIIHIWLFRGDYEGGKDSIQLEYKCGKEDWKQRKRNGKQAMMLEWSNGGGIYHQSPSNHHYYCDYHWHHHHHHHHVVVATSRWWWNAKIRRSLRLDPNTECQLHDDHHFFNMTIKMKTIIWI